MTTVIDNSWQLLIILGLVFHQIFVHKSYWFKSRRGVAGLLILSTLILGSLHLWSVYDYDVLRSRGWFIEGPVLQFNLGPNEMQSTEQLPNVVAEDGLEIIITNLEGGPVTLFLLDENRPEDVYVLGTFNETQFMCYPPWRYSSFLVPTYWKVVVLNNDSLVNVTGVLALQSGLRIPRVNYNLPGRILLGVYILTAVGIWAVHRYKSKGISSADMKWSKRSMLFNNVFLMIVLAYFTTQSALLLNDIMIMFMEDVYFLRGVILILVVTAFFGTLTSFFVYDTYRKYREQ